MQVILNLFDISISFILQPFNCFVSLLYFGLDIFFLLFESFVTSKVAIYFFMVLVMLDFQLL